MKEKEKEKERIERKESKMMENIMKEKGIQQEYD
jgi:hypothetical protein